MEKGRDSGREIEGRDSGREIEGRESCREGEGRESGREGEGGIKGTGHYEVYCMRKNAFNVILLHTNLVVIVVFYNFNENLYVRNVR